MPPAPVFVDETDITIDPEVAVAELTLPVDIMIEPVEPNAAPPVRRVTEPDAPALAPAEPLPTTIKPEPDTPVPLPSATNPVDSKPDTPEATVTAPELPLAVVPELNSMRPELPAAAFALRITTSPDDVRPVPLTSLIEPPSKGNCDDAPAIAS